MDALTLIGHAIFFVIGLCIGAAIMYIGGLIIDRKLDEE